jgi:hypothetical protein
MGCFALVAVVLASQIQEPEINIAFDKRVSD